MKTARMEFPLDIMEKYGIQLPCENFLLRYIFLRESKKRKENLPA